MVRVIIVVRQGMVESVFTDQPDDLEGHVSIVDLDVAGGELTREEKAVEADLLAECDTLTDVLR